MKSRAEFGAGVAVGAALTWFFLAVWANRLMKQLNDSDWGELSIADFPEGSQN